MSTRIEKTIFRAKVLEDTVPTGATSMTFLIPDVIPQRNNTTPDLWWMIIIHSSTGASVSSADADESYDTNTGELTISNAGTFTFNSGDIVTVMCGFKEDYN